LDEAQATDAIITFIAIPLILIIGLYLLACTIAPVVNLNNQTFKIIFTLAGGIPTLLFYSKSQIKRKKTPQKYD
jgi:hypothetical protein